MSSLSRADHAMTTGREGEIHCLLEPNSLPRGRHLPASGRDDGTTAAGA